ncbi:MAG: cysteine synthase family protein [Kofleriaceae bacterium]|nr:cysteine synthase family protein [Kofleriaceae bacterium]
MNTQTPDFGSGLLGLIGNTPLLRLPSVEKRAGGDREIWAKCEFQNPGGSVKDRAAKEIILDGIARGELLPGDASSKRLIDSTSGNTGVAYSMIGAALGIPVTLVMPANVSVARKNIVSAYGAEIIYSSELEGSDGAIVVAKQLAQEHPETYFYPDQYANPNNPGAHYRGTGPEIFSAIGDKISHFCAGIGTTGTVIGTGRYLKEVKPSVQVIAIEPDDSFHGLEGLKHLESSIVPPIWQPEGIVDRMLGISTEDGWDAAERLVGEQGIFVGHSAGANIAGACQLAKEAGPGCCVVTILPDRGDRYFRPMTWEKHYVW